MTVVGILIWILSALLCWMIRAFGSTVIYLASIESVLPEKDRLINLQSVKLWFLYLLYRKEMSLKLP